MPISSTIAEAKVECIPLDFTALVEEVTTLLDRTPIMVLATCAQDRVTARSMSVVHNGLVIFFQTATTSDKYRQLSANPSVALCAGNLQIEGQSRDLGHPLDPENTGFAQAYASRHPGSFRTYSGLPTNRVIEVIPARAVLWKYDASGKPFQDFLDLKAQWSWREMYPLE